jgi:hypothetical protein
MGKMLFSFLVLFSAESFGQTFTCEDSSHFSDGKIVELSIADPKSPEIKVIDKNGIVLYDGKKELELEDTDNSSLRYYSYSTEFLIALGYDEDDYDTTHVKFNVDNKELSITAYIGGEEAGHTSYTCM